LSVSGRLLSWLVRPHCLLNIGLFRHQSLLNMGLVRPLSWSGLCVGKNIYLSTCPCQESDDFSLAMHLALASEAHGLYSTVDRH
jgi:hypothetical protein